MNLDLYSFNAKDLTFEVTLSLPKKVIGKLLACFPKSNEETSLLNNGILFFGEDYEIANKKLFERGFIVKQSNKKKDFYNIKINYSRTHPLFGLAADQNNMRPLSVLLDCLAELGQEFSLTVSAFFEYSSKKYKPALVTLPILLESNEAFDEIRGIRFIKSHDGKLTYSAIIDRPENKDYYVSANFNYTGPFSKELPEKILKYSSKIAGGTVIED